MVTFDFRNVPWFARQRRTQARMRQVTELMFDHYLRYPQTARWAPAHQRITTTVAERNHCRAQNPDSGIQNGDDFL